MTETKLHCQVTEMLGSCEQDCSECVTCQIFPLFYGVFRLFIVISTLAFSNNMNLPSKNFFK